MTRRSNRILVLVVLLALVLAACQVPVTPAAPGEQPAATGETTLLYMTHSYDPAIPVNEQIIQEFEEAHPEVDIIYDHAPHANFEQKLLTAFAGGEGPDIFWAGDWMMPQFIEQGIIAPVDYSVFGVNSAQEYLELFEPGSLDPFMHEGEVYTAGLSEYNTFSLLYNIDVFNEAGVPLPSETEPMTWEEFATFAEQLAQQDENGNITRNAIEWPFATPIWTVLILEPFVHQLGGQLINPDTGLPQFDSEEMIKTMQYVQDLRYVHNAMDPALMTDTFEDFANGITATAIGGPWAISVLRNLNPDLNYGVAPLPKWADGERVTTLYAWAWFVSAKSTPEKQKLAWEFANLLSSKGQLWWDDVRYVQSRLGEAATGESLVEYRVASEPLLSTFLEDYKYGKFEFRSTAYFELSNIWTRATTRILEGEDVATVLGEAQTEAQLAAE
jgi:multiple sugar transport system substrate-binding protein